MRVLLIDDSSAIQKVIRLGLGTFSGAVLKVCDSLERARAEFAEFAPHIVVGAQTVAGLNCGRAYLELAENKATVVALADDLEGETHLRKLGYRSILRKPFTLGDFRDLLAAPGDRAQTAEFMQRAGQEDTVQIRFQKAAQRANEISNKLAEAPERPVREAYRTEQPDSVAKTASAGRADLGKNAAEVEVAFRETIELAQSSPDADAVEVPDHELQTSGGDDYRLAARAATVESLDLAGRTAGSRRQLPPEMPKLTMSLQELEGSLQKSLKGEVSVPQISQSQARLIDEQVQKAKGRTLNSLIGAPPAVEVHTIRQPESEMEEFIIEDAVVHGEAHSGRSSAKAVSSRLPIGPRIASDSNLSDAAPPVNEIFQDPNQLRAEHGLPKSATKTAAGAGGQASAQNDQSASGARLLEEYKRVQIERQIRDEIAGLEARIKTQLRLELETQFMQSVDGLIRPQIDSYLNKHWPTVVKSVTHQVKKSVETEYTSRMHNDLVQMQKRLAVDLKAELRTEVQDALRNWMGSYSRDILKEVAREELQKLLENV